MGPTPDGDGYQAPFVVDGREPPDNESFTEFLETDTNLAILNCFYCEQHNAHTHTSDPAHPPRLAIGRWEGNLVCYEHARHFDRNPHPQMLNLNSETPPLALWPF